MSWFLLDRNLKLLEPYDWKLSRTVLRGERGSNAPDLPGKAIASANMADKERSQILSINLANAANRLYKEVWIGLGGTQSAVYATEVSGEEYLCYTTEETEKLELTRLTEKLGGNIELAIKQLAESKRQENK